MNLNFDPFWRSRVGFDRILDLMDESLRHQPENNYPPYNILRTGENSYRISLAVAGFKPDQMSVTVPQNTLVVAGRENQKTDHDYVHRGIAARDFERRFSLADFVEVKDATFEDGLLQVDLAREVREAMKPKRIEIRSGQSSPRQQVQNHRTRASRVVARCGLVRILIVRGGLGIPFRSGYPSFENSRTVLWANQSRKERRWKPSSAQSTMDTILIVFCIPHRLLNIHPMSSTIPISALNEKRAILCVLGV